MTARAWLVFVIAGISTWALRASLVVLGGRLPIPPLLARSFRYVGPSVLAALSMPAILAPSGALTLSPPHLIAGVTAALVAWRWRSFLATLVAGLGVFSVASHLL